MTMVFSPYLEAKEPGDDVKLMHACFHEDEAIKWITQMDTLFPGWRTVAIDHKWDNADLLMQLVSVIDRSENKWTCANRCRGGARGSLFCVFESNPYNSSAWDGKELIKRPTCDGCEEPLVTNPNRAIYILQHAGNSRLTLRQQNYASLYESCLPTGESDVSLRSAKNISVHVEPSFER